jgi:hypothetical protein
MSFLLVIYNAIKRFEKVTVTCNCDESEIFGLMLTRYRETWWQYLGSWYVLELAGSIQSGLRRGVSKVVKVHKCIYTTNYPNSLPYGPLLLFTSYIGNYL